MARSKAGTPLGPPANMRVRGDDDGGAPTLECSIDGLAIDYNAGEASCTMVPISRTILCHVIQCWARSSYFVTCKSSA